MALPDARRAPPEQVLREIELARRSPVVTAVLDAADGAVFVVNAQRQIVAANDRGQLAGDAAALAGLRMGEALGCVNARAAGDCGASPACRQCGALTAMLCSQREARSLEAECLLRSELPGRAALELNVRATPLQVEGHRFTAMSLRDVSAEKRRDALEQLFLHDVLNTVAGLRGWAARVRRGTVQPAAAFERMDQLTGQLEREIRDHRALLLAERRLLVLEPAPVRASDLLAELEAVFSSHAAARERRLAIAPAPAELVLHTDASLLLRVLVNMVMNGLEASPSGGEVRVACGAAGGEATLKVHNAGVIPPEVQARIFQRSFSTKAARGRGLGTYGMKLLGEQVLGGEVSFSSDPERGTVFAIRLPLRR
ncbi:sensor histidine kinase [Anaeromyxobacter terrae]|uniref:sensor histidine kinase n=1 Tax=Anaeromyxobacter terrae TaxID=2925406 RepID=UPI001F5A7AD5|nr:sensor histidine kinase [Anaeromyxobacter sp. SG22]